MTKQKKRSPGTCSIRQHHGKWQVRYTAYDPQTGKSLYTNDGKLVAKAKSFKTKTEANRFIAEYQTKREQCIAIDSSKMLFAKYVDSWFQTYSLVCNKPYTRDSTKGIINNHLIPWFGKLTLAELSITRLQAAFNAHSDQLSAKTLRNIKSVLSTILRDAYNQGLIVNNPVNLIKIKECVSKQIRSLDLNEAGLFLNALKRSKYASLLFFCMFTGLREGEVLGLTWDRITYKDGYAEITIDQQLTKDGKFTGSKFILAPTKTNNSRVIVLGSLLTELLDKEKAKQQQLQMSLGEKYIGNPFGLVFTKDDGTLISAMTLWKHFNKLRQEIGCPDITIHSLRHTYATLHAENGLPNSILKTLLGHTTIGTTMKYYVHTTDPAKLKAAMLTEDLIKQLIPTDK